MVGYGDVDYSVVVGFVRWGMRWWIFRWCVGEVAIHKSTKSNDPSVFYTPKHRKMLIFRYLTVVLTPLYSKLLSSEGTVLHSVIQY